MLAHCGMTAGSGFRNAPRTVAWNHHRGQLKPTRTPQGWSARDEPPPVNHIVSTVDPAQPWSGRVTARTAARLAWSLWGLAMALEATGILLWLDNHGELVDRFGSSEDFTPHVFIVPSYATVGAVIAARTRNRIGWLFLAFGLIAALAVVAGLRLGSVTGAGTACAGTRRRICWPFPTNGRS
jgi:hypothetical protein